MKKSEIYRLAQGAVVLSNNLCVADKLAILRELIEKEDVALYWEQKEEKGNAE